MEWHHNPVLKKFFIYSWRSCQQKYGEGEHSARKCQTCDFEKIIYCDDSIPQKVALWWSIVNKKHFLVQTVTFQVTLTILVVRSKKFLPYNYHHSITYVHCILWHYLWQGLENNKLCALAVFGHLQLFLVEREVNQHEWHTYVRHTYNTNTILYKWRMAGTPQQLKPITAGPFNI